ncbi:oligoendopeptidase F [Spiroplasma cantharicola]|uniref:Oligopeptidase F n=1 Tax=Spiroplasma cantharicola TaxID=362837 RepID=A0A0M4K293_9MOLU|nr:oligoendopeptidase F [Spiroplasma cantharicola]ALD66862.1 oligoendopeptidase F [Spiroplasma cantharicola]
MKRKEANEKYKWDFSHLYKNFDNWKIDLDRAKLLSDKIFNLKGKLENKTYFLEYLGFEKDIDLILSKLNQYSHLIDIDQTNNENQHVSALLDNFYQDLNIKKAFVLNELKEIGELKILQWLNEENKEEYNYYFKTFFKSSKFILSKTDEELMSKVSRSRNAVGNLYDSLSYADKQNSVIEWNGKQLELSLSLYKEIMENSDPIKDQEKRREANDLYFKNYSSRKHSFAKIYEAIIQVQNEDKNVRSYNSILEMNLFDDQVSEEIYLNLIKVGKSTINCFKKYNKLIKSIYNFDKFYSTDRLLKISKDYKREFSVDEAKEIVINCLKVLGNDYQSKLNIALKDSLIDYYEDENKSDGAYSSGGNGVEPIILMNWDYKLGSISTLVHEVGHSVHTLFADQFQKYPLNNYPIILAEVASTFNEHLLFDYLFSSAKDIEEKKYLLQQRIFDLISTFYRQIQFADFEYSAHKLIEDGKPITTESLKDLFLQKQNEFGYDQFDDKDEPNYSWPYISHFFQSPFYVYKYALDLVASFKLYKDFKNGNSEIITDFLKLGGSKPPLEILKEVGVDFLNENTYKPLIEEINNLIKELEKITK